MGGWLVIIVIVVIHGTGGWKLHVFCGFTLLPVYSNAFSSQVHVINSAGRARGE